MPVSPNEIALRRGGLLSVDVKLSA